MKICENGIIRDMTVEEITELERLAEEQPAPEPTAEERIAAAEVQIQAAMADIEKAKNDLSDVQTIKNILGLEEEENG